MGPPELKPPLPGFEWANVPHASRFVSKRTQECNWLQAMEGGIDSAHVSFLHRYDLKSDSLHVSKGAELTAKTDVAFEVIETDGGMVIGVRRPAQDGPLLLAHHAMDHAVPHHDPALRRQRAQRPRLGADRRRELHGRGASRTIRRAR